MKNLLFLFLFFIMLSSVLSGQASYTHEDIIIISFEEDRTGASTDEGGKLIVNVSPQDLKRFKSERYVRYSDLGAKGDGKTDDMVAIAATHAIANHHNLEVKADEGFTYYLGRSPRTAEIRTKTDFGKANFIIDDRDVENRNSQIFIVSSDHQPFKPEGITSIKKYQKKLNVSFPGRCIITVTDSNVKRYIRYGPNQNSGSPQTDIFIVDEDGTVDSNTPIIWDFDQVTDISARLIDEDTLTVSGGRFTTIANQAESKYTYFSRGFSVRRSNVIVDGMEHHITGEVEHGAPYSGFISAGDCSGVVIRNSLFTGHKVYQTIGAAGVGVSMGSYDLSVNRALNISFIDCRQTNDINDGRYWGIFGSNYCKNLLYDNCTFSRFDAHMGVANATIRNSTLGHQGINAIGSGQFLVENSTIYGRNLINFRSDYGSTWQGELIIRDCVFQPLSGRMNIPCLMGGSYSGQHDFGYVCYMPEKITIENLKIEDGNHPEDYEGPSIFADFNPQLKDETYKEQFPYVKTKQVILKNVTTASGKKLRISDNTFMFRDVKLRFRN